ncbi:hypothetical protein HDU98_004762, partial [Podochytrium sp. JEL0797]
PFNPYYYNLRCLIEMDPVLRNANPLTETVIATDEGFNEWCLTLQEGIFGGIDQTIYQVAGGWLDINVVERGILFHDE